MFRKRVRRFRGLMLAAGQAYRPTSTAPGATLIPSLQNAR
jgi:hypothetical protein